MTLLQTQRIATYMAAGAALSTVLMSGEIPLPITIVALIGFGLSFFFGERLSGRGTFFWNAAVLIAMAYLTVAVVARWMDLVLAASIFAVLLLINRLFNRKHVRDYASLHLTALLVISGGAALSADLAFGVAFALFSISGTWSLTLTLLRTEIEEEAKANRIADEGASVLQSKRIASPRFLGLLASLAVVALFAGIMIFMLFPRVSFGYWGRKGVSNGQHTGFATRVELGGNGLIKDDPRVAFRVFTSKPKFGSSLGYYWRGMTMDSYQGGSWASTTHARPRRRQPVYEFQNSHTDQPGEELTIEISPDTEVNALFTTGEPKSLQFIPIQGAVVGEPLQLLTNSQAKVIEDGGPKKKWTFPDGDSIGDLTYRPAQQKEFRYTLRTILGATHRLRGLGTDYPDELKRFRGLPENLDPRIIALGKRLTDGKDPAEAVQAVEAYLGTFDYSLEIKAKGPDPLASFLFETHSGHCEYFATALAVLLRVAGIPTRMVSGFYGGQWIANGGYYAVRQGDAHAWVEVYFPGEGWNTFDATPSAGREASVNKLLAMATLWVDGLRTQWRTNVVEYDLASQIRGVQALRNLLETGTERMTRNSTDYSIVRRAAGAILVGVVALAILTVVPLLRRRQRKAQGPQIELSQSQRRAAILYRDLSRRLSRHGLTRRSAQTPQELLAETRTRAIPNGEIAAEVVERYEATRYGQQPLSAEELQEFRQKLRKI